MPGKWPKTHRLRELAQQSEALARKRLSSDKDWPRKRAAHQHDLLTTIKNEARLYPDSYVLELAARYDFQVSRASSVWSAHAIGRRALADIAPRLLQLAHAIEPSPARP